MGTDFLRDKRERHTKAWRHDILRVQGDWVADAPKVKRVYRARASGLVRLLPNQRVVLRLIATDQVVASIGVCEVATITKPPEALVQQLRDSQGVKSAKVEKSSNTTLRVDLLVED